MTNELAGLLGDLYKKYYLRDGKMAEPADSVLTSTD